MEAEGVLVHRHRRGGERERGRERERELELELETLFFKDCSLGLFRPV